MSAARAADLAAEARAALSAAGVASVTVTLDPGELASALHHGPAVVIDPPALTFETYTMTGRTWEIFIVAGPIHDRLEAWAAVDDVLAALKDPLSLASARPTNYQPANGPAYPGYVATLTETVIEHG